MVFIRLLSMVLFLVFSFTICNAETSEYLSVRKVAKELSAACNAGQNPVGMNIVYLELKDGCVVIELLPDLAPNHVRRIKRLVQEGFYNGLLFHRVIDGFMAQTGDPEGTGRGGSSLPDLKAEFSDESFRRGVLGMARAQSPDSANSQFFIMFSPGDFLNGKYTIFGKVIKGMKNVDAIKKGDKTNNGMVVDPDRIIRMQMAPTS